MSIPFGELLPNESFSKVIPTLQLAVDSHSLTLFKECERKYFYTIVLGITSPVRNIHLTFGLLIHGAREVYFHARADGMGHEEALEKTVHWALCVTWDKKLRRPWTPVHKDANKKNRFTLVRTIVWYFDKYGDNDPLKTVILSDGRPAVELKFAFDSGFASRFTGERFLICGYIDRLAEMMSQTYIDDCKTTKHTLDRDWFRQFEPFNQFSTYTFAGKVAFGLPVKGVMVDGIQLAVSFSDFLRAEIALDEDQLEEWHTATGKWLQRMDTSAEYAFQLQSLGSFDRHGWLAVERAYPMNETSCDKWGGCELRDICKRSPKARPQWIATNFVRRKWDPITSRGDI